MPACKQEGGGSRNRGISNYLSMFGGGVVANSRLHTGPKMLCWQVELFLVSLCVLFFGWKGTGVEGETISAVDGRSSDAACWAKRAAR